MEECTLCLTHRERSVKGEGTVAMAVIFGITPFSFFSFSVFIIRVCLGCHLCLYSSPSRTDASMN